MREEDRVALVDELRKALSGFPSLRDEYQERLCTKVIDDPRFRICPASVGKHHFWPGGLLRHTLEVVQFSLCMCKASCTLLDAGKSPVDDHVVALAAVFHDYAKIYCYEERGGGWVMTDYSNKIQHVYGSAEYFSTLASDCQVPERVKREVVHAILAQHGRNEWGSPVTPYSKEAWIVHLADMASVNICEERYIRMRSDKNTT